MASHQNDAVFPGAELDDEDDESQEDEEEDDDNDVVPAEPDDDAVTVAVPVSSGDNAPIPTPTATTIVVSEDAKRHRTDQIEEKKPLDDTRRLFQRLWTDEDEMGLLQGFLEYTAQRGSSHHNDTALFYDQIKSKLQLGFNKNQLVEKLRRLKKKYRNVLNKISSGKEFSFKSPHDQATFEISRKIWSKTAPIAEENSFDDDEINPSTNPNFGHSKNELVIGNSAEKRTPQSRKRSRSRSGTRTEEKRELNDGSALNRDNNNNIRNNSDNNDDNNNTNHNSNDNCNCSRSIQGLIGDTVRGCLSPILKEIQSSGNGMGSPFGFGARGFTFNSYPYPLPLSLKLGSGEVVDEKWRKQQMLELEVYSKRLKLVQDEIQAALDELRSAGAGQSF